MQTVLSCQIVTIATACNLKQAVCEIMSSPKYNIPLEGHTHSTNFY